MAVSQQVTEFRNVEMERDLNLIVMMETTEMMTDALLIVKSRVDGHVQVDPVPNQVFVLKEPQKELTSNLQEQSTYMVELSKV